jgi:hypothetical protein
VTQLREVGVLSGFERKTIQIVFSRGLHNHVFILVEHHVGSGLSIEGVQSFGQVLVSNLKTLLFAGDPGSLDVGVLLGISKVSVLLSGQERGHLDAFSCSLSSSSSGDSLSPLLLSQELFLCAFLLLLVVTLSITGDTVALLSAKDLQFLVTFRVFLESGTEISYILRVVSLVSQKVTGGVRNHLVVGGLRSLQFPSFPLGQRLSLGGLLHRSFISKLPKLIQSLLLERILIQGGVLSVSVVQNHPLGVPWVSSVNPV